MPFGRQETYTTPGTKVSWNLEPSSPASTVVITLAGTASYKLQYSVDELENPKLTDADAVWLDSNEIPAGTAASATVAFTTPVARIRLVIASLTGSLKMQVLQSTTPLKVLP